jgi:O-antigen chain-terminating methyltransferase
MNQENANASAPGQASLEKSLHRMQEQYDQLFRVVEHLAGLMHRRMPEPPQQDLPGFDYFLFETFYRGGREEVQKNFRKYLPYFKDCSPVIDLGCGRGEFLELLLERGIDSYGVELSKDMMLLCKELGLEVYLEDALDHLNNLDAGSVGGIFCSQFVEHLPPYRLVRFLELAFSRLQPGGVFAAETVNPQCLSVFANHFYMDLSHRNPVHPKTLRFMMETVGFADIRLEYTSPYPEQHKLKKLPECDELSGAMKAWSEAMNYNIDALNYVLFGPQDYALICVRPEDEDEYDDDLFDTASSLGDEE